MDERRSYGSGELTPDLIRTTQFRLREGGSYDPAEVHEFLEQVASAMEVLQSKDVAEAMRRELQRNAEISSRVVMAGQDTAERLREQAAEDARAIIEDTKRLAEQLRDASREELRRTREHIEELRRTFIVELRDMYDRVGATLYRFETASKVSELDEQPLPEQAGDAFGSAPAHEQPGGSAWGESSHSSETAPSAGSQPAEAQLPPAWTQLPREESAQAGTAGEQQESGWLLADEDAASRGDAAAVEEASREPEPTEPPVAAEEPAPLVDLRDLQAQQPAGEGPIGQPDELGQAAEPESAGEGGSEPEVAVEAGPYLTVADSDESVQSDPADAAGEDDDQRAEALIAGMDQVLRQSTADEVPPPLPEPPSLSAGAGGVPDAEGLRQFVLQAINEGQTREAVEHYIERTWGITDASAWVDHALQTGSQGQ